MYDSKIWRFSLLFVLRVGHEASLGIAGWSWHCCGGEVSLLLVLYDTVLVLWKLGLRFRRETTVARFVFTPGRPRESVAKYPGPFE